MNRSTRRLFGTTALVAAGIAGGAALGQEALPFLEPPGPPAERTMELSTHEPRAEADRLPPDAPNILIIMLDDVGPALPSAYGGVINTPTLARVAEAGVSFNRFHTSAMCSPTRAALLTGRNQHRSGFGQIAEFANAWDGYTGAWPATTASVARILGEYGYATAAFGKWHNTPPDAISRMGPYDRWPTGRLVGFDHFYGFLGGEASQYEPAVVENTVRLGAPHGENYHFTEDIAAQAVGWMRDHEAVYPEQPFFLYWAPGASHGPHHIFSEWADRYAGRFDDGWDALRAELIESQKAAGWIPEESGSTPRPEGLATWDDIPEDERPFQARLMEVFAGFTEHADTQAGRLLDEIEAQGELDNTLIFYVWSDNGSSAEGQNGTISELLAQNGIATEVEDHIRVLEEELGGLDALGSPKTDNMYHAGWAWAGSAPFPGVKLMAGYLGGTRTPLAVSWPARVEPDEALRTQFYHVVDIAPTIYDVLDITPPETVDGVEQAPIDGVSMLAAIEDADAPENKDEQYFEVMGSRAYYRDGWMASVRGPRVPWKPGVDPAIARWSPDDDEWELYHLDEDYAQSVDLAEERPELLAEMVAGFDRMARENDVYPIGGGLWSMVLHPEDAPRNRASEFTYRQIITSLPEGAAPPLGTRSTVVEVDLDLTPEAEGVIYAMGAYAGGLTLFVDEGVLTYEYNAFMIDRTRISSSAPLPTGRVRLEIESRLGEGRNAPMDVTIRADGEVVAEGRVPVTAAVGFTTNDSFDIGRDTQSPVSEAYYDRAPFAYDGTIHGLHARVVTSEAGD